MKMKTYIESKKLIVHQTPIILHIAKDDDSGKVGRVVIREGSLTWYPGYAQKGHRIRWVNLGEMIENQVPKRKRRKMRGK